jgi:hypothetical protein
LIERTPSTKLKTHTRSLGYFLTHDSNLKLTKKGRKLDFRRINLLKCLSWNKMGSGVSVGFRWVW